MGIKIGGNLATTNYSEIESDGTLACYGDATTYDDLAPIPIINARLGGGADPALETFIGAIQQYAFDVNDTVFGAYELTHTYKEGSGIEAHVHWANNGLSGSTRYVNWQLEYSISNSGTDVPNFYAASTTLATGDLPILSTESSLQHRVASFGTITNTYKIGAYIVWKLTRIAATGTAPIAAPFGLALGFHIIQDTMGSRQLYIK